MRPTSISSASRAAAKIAVVTMAAILSPDGSAAFAAPLTSSDLTSQSVLINAAGQNVAVDSLWASPVVAVSAGTGGLIVHAVDDAVSTDSSGNIVWPLDRWYSSIGLDNSDLGIGWTTGLGYDVSLQPDSDGDVTFFFAWSGRLYVHAKRRWKL